MAYVIIPLFALIGAFVGVMLPFWLHRLFKKRWPWELD